MKAIIHILRVIAAIVLSLIAGGLLILSVSLTTVGIVSAVRMFFGSPVESVLGFVPFLGEVLDGIDIISFIAKEGITELLKGYLVWFGVLVVIFLPYLVMWCLKSLAKDDGDLQSDCFFFICLAFPAGLFFLKRILVQYEKIAGLELAGIGFYYLGYCLICLIALGLSNSILFDVEEAETENQEKT